VDDTQGVVAHDEHDDTAQGGGGDVGGRAGVRAPDAGDLLVGRRAEADAATASVPGSP
jgi:hypothetical protein